MNLENKVVELLKNKKWHIAFAESCTGGMACARLVNVPDASAVLNESFVTYANESKVRVLGVKRSLIETHGVVSEPVAGAMASSVSKTADCEVGVGISGIAGPSGGSEAKPVGMVCFGFFIDGELRTFTKHFGDIGRNSVRESATEFVYETLCELLSDDLGDES